MLTRLSWQQIGRPLSWSILLGCTAYAAVVVAGYGPSISDASQRLGFAGWGTLLALSLANYLLRYLRWHGYLRFLGDRVAPGLHLAYYLAGFAFTTTPGKLGEAVRSLYLRRHTVSFTHSLSALFVERFLDVLAMALLALAVAWSLEDTRLPAIAAALVVVALLILLRWPRLHTWLAAISQPERTNGLRAAIARLASLLQTSAALLAPSALYGGLMIGLIAWAAEGVGLWLILDTLGTGTPLYQAIGIYAAAVLAGALSFIPGGLGSTEAVMVLLLSFAGVDTADALAATLICRIVTLWFAVAIGMLVIAGLETKGIHFSRMDADTGS